MGDNQNFIASQNKHIELANALIENANGNEEVIRLANEIIKSCNNAISIAQKADQIFISNNFARCPRCKENFHFEDAKIIEDVWAICPICGNKIYLLQ